MNLFSIRHHLVGGSLLIAGMSIGVGMLALPVVTSEAGFFPAALVYLICWMFMVAFGRLVLEACTWFPKGANLITLSSNLLGRQGTLACWILYLFLFYCLMTAHIAAGSEATGQIIGAWAPSWLSALIYCALFVPVVYLGTKSADRMNVALMLGIALTYSIFIVFSVPDVSPSFLLRANWRAVWQAFPVILTAFGFQNLIPTLYAYMDKDHKTLRKAIWIGTSIPLAIYLVWNLLVLGIVPESDLANALHQGQSAIPPLQNALQNSFFSKVAQTFAFFAMTTSFIGIGLAFVDFWADGLRWPKRGMKKFALLALVFAIPLFFVLFNPAIFIASLEFAGGIGVILLLGALPVFLVWSGRYIHRHPRSSQFVPGGKAGLLILLAFCLFILSRQLTLTG